MRFRSGRTRPEVNEPLNMSQSFLTGELFPNLGFRRAAATRTNDEDEDDPSNRVME